MSSPFQRQYFDLPADAAEDLNNYCRTNKKVKKDLLTELVAEFIRKNAPAKAATKKAKKGEQPNA